MAKLSGPALDKLLLDLKGFPQHGRPLVRYPAPRRRTAPVFALSPVPAPAPAGGFPLGGFHAQVAQFTNAGATTVVSTLRISRPFMIRYVEFFTNAVPLSTTNFAIKVATDNNTAGGINTSGIPLDEGFIGGADCVGDGQMHRAYPHRVWPSPPYYIKIVHENPTAGGIVFQCIVDCEYLA